MKDLKKYIRNIKDFPKKGIVFRDITTLIGNAEAFKAVIDELADKYKNEKISAVVCIESRGFIFGSALAYKLGARIVPVRKKGKLPSKAISATYSLEYGTDTLEMHEDALDKKDKVVIVDDLLATGGTVKAVIEMVEKLNAKIEGIAFVIELSFLKGREKLKKYSVYSLVDYDSE